MRGVVEGVVEGVSERFGGETVSGRLRGEAWGMSDDCRWRMPSLSLHRSLYAAAAMQFTSFQGLVGVQWGRPRGTKRALAPLPLQGAARGPN